MAIALDVAAKQVGLLSIILSWPVIALREERMREKRARGGRRMQVS